MEGSEVACTAYDYESFMRRPEHQNLLSRARFHLSRVPGADDAWWFHSGECALVPGAGCDLPDGAVGSYTADAVFAEPDAELRACASASPRDRVALAAADCLSLATWVLSERPLPDTGATLYAATELGMAPQARAGLWEQVCSTRMATPTLLALTEQYAIPDADAAVTLVRAAQAHTRVQLGHVMASEGPLADGAPWWVTLPYEEFVADTDTWAAGTLRRQLAIAAPLQEALLRSDGSYLLAWQVPHEFAARAHEADAAWSLIPVSPDRHADLLALHAVAAQPDVNGAAAAQLARAVMAAQG